MKEKWLRIDERSDVSSSISEVLRHLKQVETDPISWKWATIALISGLNSSLVCNLTGTANIGCLADKNAKKAIAAIQWNASTDVPNPFLASPVDLLKRATGRADRFESAGSNIELSDEDIG